MSRRESKDLKGISKIVVKKLLMRGIFPLPDKLIGA